MCAIPELVIFDCDGVLVDSEAISNEVLASHLTSAGVVTSPSEALQRYRGKLLSEVVADAEERLGGSLGGGFIESFECERAVAFQRRLQPIDGAAATVRTLRDAGVAVCVASQGKLEKTELTLRLTGLLDLFDPDALFSAYSVPRGKPHPDLFLYAAEKMGVLPECCVVIEDTAIGATAGIAAGMVVLRYAPDGDADALRAPDAQIIRSLTDAPPALGLAPQ